MKNREDASMITAFKSVYAQLEGAGHKPRLHILDNECSRAVQNFLTTQGTTRQNVEAHNHRENAAEPAVKTAKYHIILHIVTLNPNCPIQLWSKMLPQIEDTLNMLRTSRCNNKLTSYEELHGSFDRNHTPLAPLGTKGVVFIPPGNRNTFTPHCDKAFVVSRAPYHYRLMEFLSQAQKATTSQDATASIQLIGQCPPFPNKTKR